MISMEEFNYAQIGDNIRKMRKKRKYTQEYLAEQVGVNTSHISNIENHHTNVSLPTLVRICNALDTTVDYMICHEYSTPDSSIDRFILTELQQCPIDTKERILKIIQILK